MATVRFVFVALTAAAVTRPLPVEAGQAVVGALIGTATSLDAKTELSIAVGTRYQVSRHVGLGVEITAVPTLKPEAVALMISPPTPPPALVAGIDGRATVFTTYLRVEIAPSAGIVPYVIGGGGVANVKETFAVTPAAPLALPIAMPQSSVTQSSTDLVLTAGGGVGVPVGGRVSLDIDVRYLRLMARRDRNVGRFGAGISYRF